MSEDNWSSQADEVEALSSIYGEQWQVEDPVERRYSIVISHSSEYSICLQVTFSDAYPSDRPPDYKLHAPWLRGADRLRLENRMQETCREHVGECMVYQLIDTVREFLEDSATSFNKANDAKGSLDSELSPSVSPDVCDNSKLHQLEDQHAESDGEGCDEELDEYGFDPALHAFQSGAAQVTVPDSDDDVPLPVIHHGEKVTDRKSVFMGHLAQVTHKKQVKMVLDSLKENRKIAAATHNIIAYRIDGGRGVFISGCEDDGEIHAGSRMLHLLNIMDARNVMVIVTRWYGGTHLGPDRFKHINNCTRDLLEAHGYIKDKTDKKGPKSSSTAPQLKKKKR